MSENESDKTIKSLGTEEIYHLRQEVRFLRGALNESQIAMQDLLMSKNYWWSQPWYKRVWQAMRYG